MNAKDKMNDDPEKDSGKKIHDLLRNMNGVQLERYVQLYDSLISSLQDIETYDSMTNQELAQELMNTFWADLPVFTHRANLLDVVISRLQKTGS